MCFFGEQRIEKTNYKAWAKSWPKGAKVMF